jgi:cytochrome c biogenesis factor
LQINKNLLNGIINIHPLVYITCICVIFIASARVLQNFKFYINWRILVIYFSILLILGAFWAAQELAWGGWWAWDITECTILFVYLILIYMLHLMVSPIQIIYNIFIIFLFLSFFYVFNKTSLILSVHAFDTLYDNNYVMLLVMFIIFYSIYKKYIYAAVSIFFFFCIYKNMALIVVLFIFCCFVFSRHNLLVAPVFFFAVKQISIKHFFLIMLMWLNSSFYSFVITHNYLITFTNMFFFFNFSEITQIFEPDYLIAKNVFTNFFLYTPNNFFFFYKKFFIYINITVYYVAIILFFKKKKKYLFL